LLFVDDVFIFGARSSQEFKAWKRILDPFCEATRMQINMVKPNIIYNDLREDVKSQLLEILPYACKSIDSGLKYLGFELKPNSYSFNDWVWIIKKFKLGYPLGLTYGYHVVVGWSC
jgi:hypothetical protein